MSKVVRNRNEESGMGKRESPSEDQGEVIHEELSGYGSLGSLDTPLKYLNQGIGGPSTQLELIKSLVYSKGKTNSSIVRDIKKVIEVKDDAHSPGNKSMGGTNLETHEDSYQDLSDLDDVEVLTSSDFI